MNRVAFALLLSGTLASVACAQTPEVHSPEAKVIQRWIGNWEIDGEWLPGEWVTDPGKFQESKKADLILERRFVEENIRNPRSAGRSIIGYDPNRKAYQAWYCDSTGATGLWTGTWDEATNTMHWTSDLGPSIDAKAVTRFRDADHYDYDLTIKRSDGVMLMRIQASHARAKP